MVLKPILHAQWPGVKPGNHEVGRRKLSWSIITTMMMSSSVRGFGTGEPESAYTQSAGR
jgi:hypothetical protein